MLLDWGWSELMLIGLVALVVIGPKDLPRAMRVAGYWMRKARNLSREFQDHIEELMRESELAEMRDELKKAGQIDPDHHIENPAVAHDGFAAETPAELADFSHTDGVAEAEGEAELSPAYEGGVKDAERSPERAASGYRKRGVPGFRFRASATAREEHSAEGSQPGAVAEPVTAHETAAVENS